jgi:hypothetical protein
MNQLTLVMEMQRVCNEVRTEVRNVICMCLMIQLFCGYADFIFLYVQVLQLSSEESGVDL